MSTVDQQRAEMVRRLRAEGITDQRVREAMGEVPRERFVPAEHAEQAYLDMPLGIGSGQTISTPWIVALSASALEAGPEDVVLEVGTGSGYGAAVLSRCCRAVVTIERHPELAEQARARLSELGYDNVEVRTGDGSLGAADRAPFPGILVTAMASREPPSALVEQLTPDGTLICPVGIGSTGTLQRYRGGRTEELADVAFVPLTTERS